MNNENNTVSCVNWNPRPEWEHWTGSNKCPMCGSDDIEYNTQIVLTSYPPQAQLRCNSCGHYFSSGVKKDLIDHDALSKVWEHDQSILGIPKVGDWPPSPQPGDFPPATNKTTMYGWVCPKCGAVLAPHVASCPYCSPVTTINITY